MKVENVTRDDWIVAGLAFLLVLDLVILAWFSVSATIQIGTSSVNVGGSASGTDAPDSLLGILAVLALIALIVDLAIERLSPQTQVPAISGSRTTTRFVLAAVAAGFMALKFLLQISHFSDLGIGFWLGLVLVGGLVYVAMQANGGTATFPKMPRSGSTTPRGGSTPPPA